MRSWSVLQSVRESDVRSEPYPHVIIRNALPDDLADELTKRFPIGLFDGAKNNHRMNIDSSDALSRNDIPAPWSEFIKFHTSQQFLDELVSVFGAHIVKLYPHIYPSRESLSKLKAGLRNLDSYKRCDVLIDALISVNSPVAQVSSVRKVHVDKPNKLFVGLYYLRQPQDLSTGGSLQICQWKSDYDERGKLRNYTEGLPADHFELIDEIAYENNVCVLFLNSMDSLHGVTPRSITGNFRTFANLVGEVDHALFEKEAPAERWRKKIDRIRAKYFGSRQ